MRQPPLNDRENVTRFVGRQLSPLLNFMCLEQTPAATGRRCGVRDECGMVAPGSLPAVVRRIRRSETPGDDLRRLLHHMGQTPRLEVRELAAGEAELAAEPGESEAVEGGVEVDHGTATVK